MSNRTGTTGANAPTAEKNTALIVIDVQKGFDAAEIWGPRDNPAAEANISRLITTWQAAGRPIVVVQHASPRPGPLHRASPGFRLKDCVDNVHPDLHIFKSVNSAFYGTPDLHAWLGAQGITSLVICGIQTNMCVETTARMAGNLGYEVEIPLDACHTFDLRAPDGEVIPAATLSRITATNLSGGRFASITTTDALVETSTPTRIAAPNNKQ